MSEGDTKGAKPYFERALAADPKAAGAMNGLARVLSSQGEVEGAIKIWKQMVETIPGVHAGTVGLADAYLGKGEYDKALPLLEQWASADPQNEAIQNKLKLARDKAKPGTKKNGA
jgi:pentatricopeptide repeat protein